MQISSISKISRLVKKWSMLFANYYKQMIDYQVKKKSTVISFWIEKISNQIFNPTLPAKHFTVRWAAVFGGFETSAECGDGLSLVAVLQSVVNLTLVWIFVVWIVRHRNQKKKWILLGGKS